MKIFITGGNGFIGSYVVRRLIERGDEVRCLVRSSSDTSRIDGLPWERFVGDVRDKDSLIKGAEGCDAIIHLASPSSWNDIQNPAMNEIVFEGTKNILEVARLNGNVRVVYCSTVIAINGTQRPSVIDERSKFSLTDPSLVYAQAKHKAEKLCTEAFQKYKQNVVMVNPSEVYGPNDFAHVTAGNLIDFATSWPVLVTRGGTSIVHVEDVADGVIAALDRGQRGERYILGGDNLTIYELAEMTLEIVGKKVPIIQVPNTIIKVITWIGTTLRLPLPYNPLVIPYATRFWMTDNSRAKDELNVRFRNAKETLEPTIQWLIDIGEIPSKKLLITQGESQG